MSLEEGHLLGRYRVEAFLAEGGMGRIYRAVDTLLGRRVALKVLAGQHPEGSPAVARLLREARAAAALSHPNICSVFDVGEAEGRPFIAMELVQGTSLRALLDSPDVGLDQRLRWVHDLAGALAAAHRAHLVHRDIKPDNVMVGDDGRVRLLDFGIATWAGGGIEPGAADGPAGAFRTQDGQVLGTVGYMAPEQASGARVDARTDQFAWGVLAYETLSGRHPFGADGRFGTPPLLSGVTPALPFGVAAIIAKALALDPPRRFADMDEIVAQLAPAVGAAPAMPPPDVSAATAQRAMSTEAGDAHDDARDADGSSDTAGARDADGTAGAALGRVAADTRHAGDARDAGDVGDADARESGELGPATTRALRPRRAARRLWRGAVLAGALLIGAGAAVRVARAPRSEAPAAPSIELTVSNVQRVTFGDGCEEFPSFLPDGRALIYEGDDGEGHELVYRLELTEGARPRVLVHQDDPGRDTTPSVSPAGDRIAFVHSGAAAGATMVINIDGTEPRKIGATGMFPRWSLDGRGVWTRRDGGYGLYDPSSGAALRTVTLPTGMSAIWLLGRIDGPVLAQVTSADGSTPSGLVMLGADGRVRWQLDEELEPVLAMAPDGRHALVSRQSIPGQAELIAVPLDGSPVVSLASTTVIARDGLDVSRDGKRIAWSTCRPVPRVSTVDAAGRFVPTLTSEADDSITLAHIPGSSDLAVVSGRTGRPRLWVMDPAGVRPPRQVPIGERTVRDIAISPDGARFAASVPGAGIAVGMLHGDPGVRMLTDTPGDASPYFRKGGGALVFTRPTRDGMQVMTVPLAGGPPTPLFGADTHSAAASPLDDTIVYLTKGRGVPLVSDGQGSARPLCPALPAAVYRDLRFSPDGARVLVSRARRELLEIDAASGQLLRTIAAEPRDLFYSPSYAGDGRPIVIRVRWQGSIFVADAAFRSTAPAATAAR